MSPVYEQERGKTPVWLYVVGGCCGCLVLYLIVSTLFGLGTVYWMNRHGGGPMAQMQAQAQAQSESAACKANLSQIWVALQAYTNEWDGYLPPADSWCDALATGKAPVPAGAFSCPSAGTSYSYAFSDNWAGKKLADISNPSAEALVFDSSQGTKNAHAVYGSAADAPHSDGMNVLFADGSVASQ